MTFHVDEIQGVDRHGVKGLASDGHSKYTGRRLSRNSPHPWDFVALGSARDADFDVTI